MPYPTSNPTPPPAALPEILVTFPVLPQDRLVTFPALPHRGPVTFPALPHHGPVTFPALPHHGPVTFPALPLGSTEPSRPPSLEDDEATLEDDEATLEKNKVAPEDYEAAPEDDETSPQDDQVLFIVFGRLEPLDPWLESTNHLYPDPDFYAPAISVVDHLAKKRIVKWLHRSFTVSLSKLARCSLWFQKWSILPATGPGYFIFEANNLKAFSILMNIFHDSHEEVPTTVDLDMLVKIADLVKELDCCKALDNHAGKWISELSRTHSPYSATGRDLVLWLHVSLVFPNHANADLIMRRLLLQCKGPFHRFGLPLDDDVVDSINVWRSSTLNSIFSMLWNFMGHLREGATKFSAHYEAILLGILYKQLPASYFIPGGIAGSISVSINEVVDDIFGLEAPHWEVADCHSMARESETSRDPTRPYARDSNGFQELIREIEATLAGIPERIRHNEDDFKPSSTK